MSTVLDIINRGQNWLMTGKVRERFVIIRRKNIDGVRFALFKAESPAGDQGVVIRCVDHPGKQCLLTAPNWEVIGTCDSYKEYEDVVTP